MNKLSILLFILAGGFTVAQFTVIAIGFAMVRANPRGHLNVGMIWIILAVISAAIGVILL